jgi:hypothetical protein
MRHAEEALIVFFSFVSESHPASEFKFRFWYSFNPYRK